jgi:hypothetical protein
MSLGAGSIRQRAEFELAEPAPRNRTELVVYAVAVLLIAAAAPFYYLAWSAPGFGIVHDDAIYLATAKSLATGTGYRIISLPNQIPQTKYPVIFPLLLSLVWRMDAVFPHNLQLLKLVPTLSTVAWAIGLFFIARRRLSLPRSRALCLASCLVACPWVVSFSEMLRSETLFAALTTWAVYFLLRAEDDGTLKSTLYAALLSATAYHTRTAAVAVMAGGVCGLLLAKRFRLAATFGAVCFVLCLPWLWWQAQQVKLPPAESYYTALAYKNENILTHFTGPQKLKIFFKNLVGILFSPQVIFARSITLLGIVISMAFWLTSVLGFARIRGRCLAISAAASLLIPALWSWEPWRFLIPGVGLLLLVLYRGLPNDGCRIAAYLLLMAACFGALWSVRSEAKSTQIFSTENVAYPATWPQVLEVQKWLRENSSPDDVVISSVDPLIYFYTGLKSIHASYPDPLGTLYGLSPDVDPHREYIRTLNNTRARYVVQMEPDYYDPYLTPSTMEFLRASFFREVYRVGVFRVYRVVQPPPE